MRMAKMATCAACAERVACWCERGDVCAACDTATALLFNRKRHRVWCPRLLSEADRFDSLQKSFASAYDRLLTNRKNWQFFGSQAGRYPGKKEKLDSLQEERRGVLLQLSRDIGRPGDDPAAVRAAEECLERWAIENRLERI